MVIEKAGAVVVEVAAEVLGDGYIRSCDNSRSNRSVGVAGVTEGATVVVVVVVAVGSQE